MIELPFPHKVLWPNGRTLNRKFKAAEVKKHRRWAYHATLADATRPATVARLVFTIYAKPRGPLPDRDNSSAAMKSYQDGVADAYKVDDRTFAEPRIILGERCQNGKVVVTIDP